MRCKEFSLSLTTTFAVLIFVTTLAGARAAAQSESILYSFNNNHGDGIGPRASLISDSAGNLYGTTSGGGAYAYGTVFELLPKAGGGWTEKIIHSFGSSATDGQNPTSSLIFDSFGNLYGTTVNGGSDYFGTAFELSPGKSGSWTVKIVHNFGSADSTDGWFPSAGLIFDSSGDLYGTTSAGGTYAKGEVFELTPNGYGAWMGTTLHSFGDGAADGSDPFSGLILDASGNLYGTTYQGGLYGTGTAFELSPGSAGTWTETALFSFNNGNNGSVEANSIYAGLISDSAGNLYGTGYNGGARNYGAVFELSPKASGGWTQKTLHSFDNNGTDGSNPEGGLIFDAAGNLYGTTYNGGAYGLGAVFELAP